MKKPIIIIDDFSGGMSLNDKRGGANQFHIGVNLDFSSKAGKLAPANAWVTMSNGVSAYVPDEFSDMIHVQNNTVSANPFFLGGDDATIYRNNTTTTIATAQVVSAAVKSMEEYGNYMYYSQAGGQLGRLNLSASTWESAWNTFSNTAQNYYPLHISADENLYAGHGNDISKITPAHGFTDTALDLLKGWKVRTLSDFGYLYLAIGADFYGTDNTPSKTKIYLWNRSDTLPSDEIIVPEKGIKAMIFEGGYLWIWAGRSCNMYVVPEGSRKVTKIHSFTKEDPDDIYEVYPNSVQARNGTIYFGLSGVGAESMTKNPNGIYSFPADPNKFSLNIVTIGTSNSTTPGADDKFKSLGLYRNSSYGDMFFASFYDASAAKKNLLRREALVEAGHYQDGGYYYSYRYEAPPGKEMFLEAFGMRCDPLPAGTTISMYYSTDKDMTDAGAGQWISTTGWHTVFAGFTTDDATENLVFARTLADTAQLTAKSIQLKVIVQGSSTTAKRPFVKQIYATGSLRTTNK